MDEFLKKTKLECLSKHIKQHGVSLAKLYSIVSKNNKKSVMKIKELIPEAQTFDCHKLKLALLDMEKCGRINEYLQIDSERKPADESKSSEDQLKRSTLKNNLSAQKGDKKELEIITPDKKGYGKCKNSGDVLVKIFQIQFPVLLNNIFWAEAFLVVLLLSWHIMHYRHRILKEQEKASFQA